MPKKFGVNYIEATTSVEQAFAMALSKDKIVTFLFEPDLPILVAAKNVNKSTLKKIAKSL